MRPDVEKFKRQRIEHMRESSQDGLGTWLIRGYLCKSETIQRICYSHTSTGMGQFDIPFPATSKLARRGETLIEPSFVKRSMQFDNSLGLQPSPQEVVRPPSTHPNHLLRKWARRWARSARDSLVSPKLFWVELPWAVSFTTRRNGPLEGTTCEHRSQWK